ncbi:MAG: glutamyl-tRNA reductase [Xanthomonadales bacterium]|nr:glutamyl-tRNA reductase [Gammaproteobacteria bacterium]MBT8053346.1 glutamyl-tRNA reductase [Gammaproteobacteria bacterium]NND58058.1 glutamyl-tRNA reductase [Xanthomonadales bacterium]NNK52155.1 glutamyl-tRNA reductase [Xanthomonadales bacterium]
MPLFTVGISHHTAPIDIREKVAISRSEYPDRVRQLCALPGVEEVLILGTCNRTEIYCLSTADGKANLIEWVHRINDIPAGELDMHLYQYEGEDAARHLIRVASGLDSLVLGETQILGQLKEAWQQAHDAGSLGKVLDRLFQHTFNAAKFIRTNSGISDHTVSVAYTAVVLARQIFGDLGTKTVVLVGAGEMVQLCGRYLRDHGIANLLIVNRSMDKAREISAELGATAMTLDQLGEALPMADILISSTASPSPVIMKADIKAALRQRRYRPMFLVDIAVPRDIDPEISRVKDVYLYTIDDLQQVVDENMEQRNAAAQSASADVETAVAGFMRWLSGKRAARTLKRIREQSHGFEEELRDRALRKLEAGQDPAEVLDQLTRTLTNKILHHPSKRLREAAENQDYEVLKAADRIFRLEEQAEDE